MARTYWDDLGAAVSFPQKMLKPKCDYCHEDVPAHMLKVHTPISQDFKRTSHRLSGKQTANTS